jgi:phosphatidylserine decarboxylase
MFNTLQRGCELGYFAFGGSTVLVIFQKNTIKFDQDLIVNSSKPIETLVAVGSSIGVALDEF